MPTRRIALCYPLAALALHMARAQAQQPIPVSDMHSHYGLITRQLDTSGLAEEMRAQRVAFIAWKAVPDGRWLRQTNSGIEPAGIPEPGALNASFTRKLEGMRSYIAAHKLLTVLTAADVDRCLAGEPGIVIASEGADFVEGEPGRLAPAIDAGLRLLQLVHYIPTPVGDRQTAAPTHQGLSPLGKTLIEECNKRGVLLDLAHLSGEAVDQALTLATKPLIWSHGWVDKSGGSWDDRFGYLQRRLSLARARKIADGGGVVGVWAFGLQNPGGSLFRSSGSWPVGRRDTEGYAKELLFMVEQLGRDAVALGTDIEGVGPNWVVNDYAGLRLVIEHLGRLKAPTETIEKLAYANFARVLKANLPT
ncbi:hypothetical protein GCM10028796_58760 [Ramlibacter monticola]